MIRMKNRRPGIDERLEPVDVVVVQSVRFSLQAFEQPVNVHGADFKGAFLIATLPERLLVERVFRYSKVLAVAFWANK